jgi:hypothetical protein
LGNGSGCKNPTFILGLLYGNMKKLLWIILALVVAGGIIGYYQWNKPHEKVEDMKGVAIDASKLCADFAADENKANSTYLNKALETKGVITDVSKNQDGGIVIALDGGNASSVQCTMRDKNVEAETGKTVIVKGICTGYILSDVTLTDCVLEK